MNDVQSIVTVIQTDMTVMQKKALDLGSKFNEVIDVVLYKATDGLLHPADYDYRTTTIPEDLARADIVVQGLLRRARVALRVLFRGRLDLAVEE